MPPQSTEVASQEANQPTIISFLRPMFGIQGSQEQREEQDNNQEQEQEDMEADSSRKRLRSFDGDDDENEDGDNVRQGNRVMTDSMIANTSIVVEPTPSRRRISSSTPTMDLSEHQSTPDQSLTQQMRDIR